MINLFLAELKRSWIIFVRYPSEAVTGIVTLTAIFLALVLGVQSVMGPQAVQSLERSHNLDALLVTYILWTLTLFALGGMGWTIQNEAQTGTLEQLYLSPFGPRVVFLVRAVAELFVQVIMIAVVLIVIELVTGRMLHFSPAAIPLLATVLLATYGLGFILAGMTVVFKRIQNVIQLSQFVVLFLVAVPVEQWHGAARLLGYAIPLAPGAGLLRQLMAPAAGPMPAVDPMLLVAALLNGLAYFALGLLVFTIADGIARRRGLLGGY